YDDAANSEYKNYIDLVISSDDGQVYIARNKAGRFEIELLKALVPDNKIRATKSIIYKLGTLENDRLVAVDTDGQVIVWQRSNDTQKVFENPRKLKYKDSEGTVQASFTPLPKTDSTETSNLAIRFQGQGWIDLQDEDSLGQRYAIALGDITAEEPQSNLSAQAETKLDPTYFGLPADTNIDSLRKKKVQELLPMEQYYLTMYDFYQENPSNQNVSFDLPDLPPTQPEFLKMSFFREGMESDFTNQIKKSLIKSSSVDTLDSDVDGYPDQYEILGFMEWEDPDALATDPFNAKSNPKLHLIKKYLLHPSVLRAKLESMTKHFETWQAARLPDEFTNMAENETKLVFVPEYKTAVWIKKVIKMISKQNMRTEQDEKTGMQKAMVGNDGSPVYDNISEPEADYEIWPYSPIDSSVKIKRECKNPEPAGMGGTGSCEIKLTYAPEAGLLNNDSPLLSDKLEGLSIADFVDDFYAIDSSSVEVIGSEKFKAEETDDKNYPLIISNLTLDRNKETVIKYTYLVEAIPELKVSIADLSLDPLSRFPDGFDCDKVQDNKLTYWNPITQAEETAQVYCADGLTDILVSRGEYFPGDPLYFYTGKNLNERSGEFMADTAQTSNSSPIKKQGPFYSKIFEYFHSLGWTYDELNKDQDGDNLTGFQELITGLDPTRADSDQRAVLLNRSFGDLIQINNGLDCAGAQAGDSTNDGWEDSDCDGIANAEAVAMGVALADGYDATLGKYQLEHDGISADQANSENSSEVAMSNAQTEKQQAYKLAECRPGCLGIPCNKAYGRRFYIAPPTQLSMDAVVSLTGNICTGLFLTQFGPGFIVTDSQIAGWFGGSGLLNTVGVCDAVNSFTAKIISKASGFVQNVGAWVQRSTLGLITAGHANKTNLDEQIIGGGVTKEYKIAENNVFLDTIKNLLKLRKDANKKLTRGKSGFPQIFTNWVNRISANWQDSIKRFPPTITIKYPDFARGFPIRDLEKKLKEVTENNKQYNDFATKVNRQQETADQVIKTTPAYQDWGQLVNWLGNLFAIRLVDTRIPINIPSLPENIGRLYEQRWCDWQNDVCAQIRDNYSNGDNVCDEKDILCCTPSCKVDEKGSGTKIEWGKVFDKAKLKKLAEVADPSVQSFFEKLGYMTGAVQDNLEALQRWRTFPEKLIAYKNFRQKYLKEISSLLDSVMQWSGGWIGKQVQRTKSWMKLYHDSRIILQNWNMLLDIFINYQSRCDTCKNYRCTSVKFEKLVDVFEKLFGGIMPTLPEIYFPKLPDIVIDLSHLNIMFDIQWPVLEMKYVPLNPPALPRLKLPKIDIGSKINIDLPQLPDVPVIPSPPNLPALPSIPSLPLPGLPDIPPAPKIPKLPKELKVAINLTGKLLDLVCFLYNNQFIPFTSPAYSVNSDKLTSLDGIQCAVLTERPFTPELPFDLGFSMKIPDLKINFLDKVVAGAAVDLTLNIPLASVIQGLARNVNNLVTNFVESVNT
ncbi:MAG: hypothetical protein NTZ80_01925, partial [Patescibacteria group bacterium]|nr:hypothetical protein [Patescibacteria group bacterium]